MVWRLLTHFVLADTDPYRCRPRDRQGLIAGARLARWPSGAASHAIHSAAQADEPPASLLPGTDALTTYRRLHQNRLDLISTWENGRLRTSTGVELGGHTNTSTDMAPELELSVRAPR